MNELLFVDRLSVGYGHVGVLEHVTLHVNAGSIVAIVGSNGAGKTTLLRTISGLLRPTSGQILFAGKNISEITPCAIVNAGLLHVAEGRSLFLSQTVGDNLELGLYGIRLTKDAEQARHERVFELFPVLRDRLSSTAGALSGGQQQMLAIGQSLMREPRLLMLDEPSVGLAPNIVEQVMTSLVRLRESGTTILLVEQMVERALAISDYGYLLKNGSVAQHGHPKDLNVDAIKLAYLGSSAASPR